MISCHENDGSNLREFVILLGESAGNEDHVGFGSHQAFKIDFLERAEIGHFLRLLEILRKVGQRRGLGQRHDALAQAPMVEGVEHGKIGDGDALGIFRNGDGNRFIGCVERLHFNEVGGSENGRREAQRGDCA